jgi:predicted enzyme related to lactoylglutathione lyase
MSKNPIVHVEWWTRDPSRVRGFYESVFNWTFDDNMPGYTLINTGSNEGGGGIMPIQGEENSPGIRPYVAVEDLAAYEERVRTAGGEIVMSRQEVPNMGLFTLVRDVDGNVFGLWQPVKRPEPPKPPRKKPALKAKAAGGKAKKKAGKAKKKSAKKSRRR